MFHLLQDGLDLLLLQQVQRDVQVHQGVLLREEQGAQVSEEKTIDFSLHKKSYYPENFYTSLLGGLRGIIEVCSQFIRNIRGDSMFTINCF